DAIVTAVDPCPANRIGQDGRRDRRRPRQSRKANVDIAAARHVLTILADPSGSRGKLADRRQGRFGDSRLWIAPTGGNRGRVERLVGVKHQDLQLLSLQVPIGLKEEVSLSGFL